MAQLYVLISPPGCGKSTWCKKNVDGRTSMRINRDELRKMLCARYIFGQRVTEAMITDVSKYIAKSALDQGINVVLDNTNCQVKTINDILKDAPNGVNIRWIVFDVPVWKQRYRIIKRWIKGGIWIPASVTENMNIGFGKVIEYLVSLGIKLDYVQS